MQITNQPLIREHSYKENKYQAFYDFRCLGRCQRVVLDVKNIGHLYCIFCFYLFLESLVIELVISN